MDPQLTSQIVPLEEVRQIEDCLARLVEDTSGNYVLLLDKSGQVIASQGDANRQDITALGALIAGTFASSREVAKLLREKDFRNMFQQGVRDNIFLALIEDQWILCIIFNKGTHIGLVTVLTKKATDELGHVLERVSNTHKARDDVLVRRHVHGCRELLDHRQPAEHSRRRSRSSYDHVANRLPDARDGQDLLLLRQSECGDGDARERRRRQCSPRFPRDANDYFPIRRLSSSSRRSASASRSCRARVLPSESISSRSDVSLPSPRSASVGGATFGSGVPAKT